MSITATDWTDQEKAEFTADIRKVYGDLSRPALFMILTEKDRLLDELEADPTILGDETATRVYTERIRLMVADLKGLHDEAIESFQEHLAALGMPELVGHLVDAIREYATQKNAHESLTGTTDVDDDGTRRMMINHRRDSALSAFYEITCVAEELRRRHTT